MVLWFLMGNHNKGDFQTVGPNPSVSYEINLFAMISI